MQTQSRPLRGRRTIDDRHYNVSLSAFGYIVVDSETATNEKRGTVEGLSVCA